ncbi:hypothetical protein [Magnetospira sp. QH-2]|uniref:flagellin N-terminal helical domain-containing protein n=1 Tax=Magnetospira sp. (strain QH-2) TaxID=1288970 RepID=UPI0003E818A5|nr:hypothetical protein [Magnetospira sp. QH-2]CCQ73378.1 putative Flagellin [Magnetospira sp. QH-2]
MAEPVATVAAIQNAQFERVTLDRARDRATRDLLRSERDQRFRDDIEDQIAADALNAQAAALLEARDDTEQAIQSLEATQAGLDAAGRLTDQLEGIALAAQNASTAVEREELARQFDQVASQLDNLVGDTSYQGTNLLDVPADSLRVSTSDTPGTEFTVEGRASDAASLGLGSAATDYNNFATQADIDAALSAVQSAGSTLQASAQSIGINASILEVRADFNEDLASVAQTGAARLTDSDPYESGATLQAVEVRDALNIESQRIAARSQSLIVDLVSNSF